MWTSFRNRDFFKHCACEKELTQKDNKRMNTSTNSTQISTRMMRAQQIRNRSRGATINNTMSGGVRSPSIVVISSTSCE